MFDKVSVQSENPVQSVHASLMKRLENLSLSPQRTNDINYFNCLMNDIAAMHRVRANNPTSFTSANLLLLEEANLVWSRLCAKGVCNSHGDLFQPSFFMSSPIKQLTPKRISDISAESDDASKLKIGLSTPQKGSPSSKKFFQWSTLDTKKTADDSPNWREEATGKKVWKPFSNANSPSKYDAKNKSGSPEHVINNSLMTLLNVEKKPIKSTQDILKSKETVGHIFKLEKKIFIPDHPGYNFIGRILGPRGISIRQLEAATQCGILIRGKGSVKEAEKEMKLIGTPGYKHLEEPLHVQITAMGSNMAQCQEQLNDAVSIVESLLTPTYDEYKKTQLIHLAVINGTYRSPLANSNKGVKSPKKNGSSKSPTKND